MSNELIGQRECFLRGHSAGMDEVRKELEPKLEKAFAFIQYIATLGDNDYPINELARELLKELE
jgi:hypothetical protein